MPRASQEDAESLGGSPIGFYIYVNDVDAAYNKALAAGGAVEMPVQDMFWGDRAGSLKDPFGHSWMLATHKADTTPEEMAEGARRCSRGRGSRSQLYFLD